MSAVRARILVVEDEGVISLDLRRELERLGYEVVAVVASGEEAIVTAETRTPDLVLMDIHLRGELDGVEAAEEISRRCGIPVVYLTAYADDATLARAQLTQPFGYLLKPFDERELHLLIEVALHRHRLERSVRREEERFRSLLESAPDAMVAVDERGTIALANAQAERLFGYSREELVGQPVEVLVPERFRTLHAGHRAGYAADPRPRPMGAGLALFARHKDGTQIPVEISLSPLRGAGERMVIGAIRDVTDRKRIEEELLRRAEALARSNTALNQFAFVAAHDLQEPLRMVTTYMTRLDRELGESLEPRAREYLGFAVEGASRMSHLVADLLEYSRIGSGDAPLGPVDTGAVLDDVLRHLAPEISESGATLSAGDLPEVKANHAELVLLFTNLISNAIRFRGSAAPHIAITAEAGNGEWRFTVRDNGVGFPPEQRERIFQFFQRLAPREAGSGTGMGLAICRRVVERLGGRILADSKPGEGTTIRFTIPLQPRAEAPATDLATGVATSRPLPPPAPEVPRAVRTAPPPRPEAPRSVPAEEPPTPFLVVEDNPGDVRLILEALREAEPSLAVTVARDGEEALELLRGNGGGASPLRPALVLLDLNLPRRSGREVLAEMKSDPALRGIPVVVLTGSQAAADVRDAYALQASSYLQKPGEFEELVGAMRSLTDFWLHRARRATV